MSDAFFVSAKGLDEIAAEWKASPKLVEQAMRTATVRVTRWAASQARRNIAKEVKVTGRVIKGRMVVDLKGEFGRVWFGLSPIPLKHLSPRKTSTGISAGPVKVPGGFAVKKYGRNIFKRTGPKRGPIEMQALDIEARALPFVFDIAQKVESKFLVEFENALAWHSSK